MRVLVGYGITDKAYTKLKEGKYTDVYTEYFEISGVKVFDLDNFDFYDISLKDCIENQLDIIGCDIGFEKCSSEYGVMVNSRGGVFFRTDFGCTNMIERSRVCSPLFYNNKPAIETGIELYMTYKHNCFTIVIELETLNFEIRVFEFTVLKSGDFNSNYEDFIYCVPDFGYTRKFDISDRLTDALKSIVAEEYGLVYVNDVIAVCGRYIRTDNSSSSVESMLKNGIKYVYIAITTYTQTFVIPPTVEKISIDSKFKNYLSMHNHIKLILPKVKLDSLVCQLAKEMKLSEDGYLGTLEKEIDALNKKHVLIEVYG